MNARPILAALPRICSAAALGALVGSASAQSLYFSEYLYEGARMNSIAPDGSNHQVLFTLPTADWLPLGLTFDPASQRLIWMDSAFFSKVYSANLDGSDQQNISPVSGFARGSSRDAQGRIYFSTNNLLQRVNADGSNLTTLFAGGSGDPLGNPRVDATNGHVYVGIDGEIKRMNLDGSSVKTVVRGVGQCRSIGLDIGNGYIYWIDADIPSDFVGRARLDGSDYTVLIDNSSNDTSGSSGLIELLVDPAGGKIYFADELRTNISRADINGQNVQVIYTSPAGGLAPSGLMLSTGEPVQALHDLDHNGVSDDIDIANGVEDCDDNGVPDIAQARPCPARVYLLDQGSDAANFNGRALGVPSQWQVFQPFDVPAGGWKIGEVGIDGYTVNYADGLGAQVRLYPDDGSGTKPNEATELASTRLNFFFNTNFQAWAYSRMTATLGPGRYWVRIEANNPLDYWGSVNLGFGGLQSRSRGSSGNFTSFQPPIALRIIEGTGCVGDYNLDGFVDAIDYDQFVADWLGSSVNADLNGDLFTDAIDYDRFIAAWVGGC